MVVSQRSREKKFSANVVSHSVLDPFPLEAPMIMSFSMKLQINAAVCLLVVICNVVASQCPTPPVVLTDISSDASSMVCIVIYFIAIYSHMCGFMLEAAYFEE